jgi:hypothetical protein
MELPRELAQRRQDGLEVTLLWDARTNEVSIGLVDEAHGSAFAFVVDPSAALDAFNHPFAYAAVLGGDFPHDPALAPLGHEAEL